VAVRQHCRTADPSYEVEFRQAIANTIQWVFKYTGIPWEACVLFVTVAEHGEWQLESIVAQLTLQSRVSRGHREQDSIDRCKEFE
jgi:hypothetical protein